MYNMGIYLEQFFYMQAENRMATRSLHLITHVTTLQSSSLVQWLGGTFCVKVVLNPYALYWSL